MARKLASGSGVFGSNEAAHETIASSGGGQGLIWNIGGKAPRQVRFLQDPEGWCGYWEVYLSEVEMYSPVTEGMEVPEDSRKTYRVLANALLRRDDGDRVVPLKLPKDLSNRLTNRQTRVGTLTDRDYVLSREGKGFDTKYDYDAESREEIKGLPIPPGGPNASGYELFDLEDVLLAEAEAAEQAMAKAAGSGDAEPDDSDLYDADDGVDPEEADAPEAAASVALEEDLADEPTGGGDETDYYTEDEIGAMTLGELKALAADLEIAVTPGIKKAALVTKVWQALTDAAA